MSELDTLLKLREEQNRLLAKVWSAEGKVKVQRTFQRGGKTQTQTFWVTPQQAQEMGLKPIEEPKLEEPPKTNIKSKVFFEQGEGEHPPEGVEVHEEPSLPGQWHRRTYYEVTGRYDSDELVSIPSGKEQNTERIKISRYAYMDAPVQDPDGLIRGDWFVDADQSVKGLFPPVDKNEEYKYRVHKLTFKPTSDKSVKIDLFAAGPSRFRRYGDGLVRVAEYAISSEAALYDDPDEDKEYIHRHAEHQYPPYRVPMRYDQKTGKRYYLKSAVEALTVDTMLKKFDKEPSVAERANANAERLRKFFSPEAGDRWRTRAEGLGISKDELRDRVVKKLQPLVDKGRIWIRMPSSRVNKLLMDGRFKNIAETQVRSPGKNPRVSFTEYMEDRIEIENEIFGFPKDYPAADRPIYGYLTGNNDGWIQRFSHDKERDWLSEYGDARVKIKDSVRPRTTFAMGDTLDVNTSDAKRSGVRIIPSPIGKIAPEVELGDILDTEKDYKSIEDATSMYNEVHVHKGLPAIDIEEIVFEKTLPTQQVTNRLDKLGIKYRLKGAEK